MPLLDDLQEHFYDLVLKKSLNITLKSVNCYIELSCEGGEVNIFTTICQNKPQLKEAILRGRPCFNAQNFQLDIRNQQVIIGRKYNFSKMTPQTFALHLAQFHSDVLRCRNDLNDLEEDKMFVRR